MEKPKIPDFEIKALCGSGAYGDVWLCTDMNGIARAVKTLDKERLKKMGVLQREEKAIQLFRTQVPKHANLVEIFHIGETESIIYYVMELAGNIGSDTEYNPDTLENRLKSRIYSPEGSVFLISALLAAVQVLHDAELAHRDIKPSNIVFVNDVPKLADIGLVTSTNTEVSIVGTVNFMPPDSSTGNDADIYSMGKILYCVFTGRAVQDFPTLPDRFLSSKSALLMRLNKVAIKACSKIPANRFKSVSQFKSALNGDSGALKDKSRPMRRILLLMLLLLGIIIGVCLFYYKIPFKLQDVSNFNVVKNEQRTDIENELQMLSAFAASGEWQRAIDVISQIKVKYPQADHAYLDKLADKGTGEIAKTQGQAEIEKARIETEKNKLALEKNKIALEKDKLDLEREKHESEKVKFETAKTRADSEIKQAGVEKSQIENLKSEIFSLKSKSARVPIGFEMLVIPTPDTDGWASEIRHKATGIEMAYVAPGDFMMGSPLNEENRGSDERQYNVKLTKGYYIGKYEVTRKQYGDVMGSNPLASKDSGEDEPVGDVSWYDCEFFCQKIGSSFRLPSEAEWEFASRGGRKSMGFIYSGSNNLDEVGWYEKDSDKRVHAVGRKKPNEIGLYDMSGNVWEWCYDWYAEYPSVSVTDPVGVHSGVGRVCRGGSWSNDNGTCRLALRYRNKPGNSRYSLGFRPVMDIQEAEISNHNQQTKLDPSPGSDWTIPDIGMEFVWIKALELWVGKYEVTNLEYRKFKVIHDSKEYKGNSLNGDRQPAVFVNFDDAVEYAKWLTERERKLGRLPPGYSYRLPTGGEWMKFCQCGDNREYPWGNGMPPKYGNYCGKETKRTVGSMIFGYDDGFTVTCSVEMSGKNEWELYGVGGNVSECTIKSSSDLSFDSWRGASWRNDGPGLLRSTYRFDINASCRSNFSGFRLVLSR